MKDADSVIQVMYDGEICAGRVSSHAMALGSLVWEKFIFPPWSRSKETKDLEGQDVQTSPVQQLKVTTGAEFPNHPKCEVTTTMYTSTLPDIHTNSQIYTVQIQA
jgi:hypothetical protein